MHFQDVSKAISRYVKKGFCQFRKMVNFQEKNISVLNNIFVLFLSYCITDLASLYFERLTCKFKELEKAE